MEGIEKYRRNSIVLRHGSSIDDDVESEVECGVNPGIPGMESLETGCKSRPEIPVPFPTRRDETNLY